jgi:hypothetical protein
LCVADPGSGVFFLSQDPDPGSQTHIFESLPTIFCVKNTLIRCQLAEIVSVPVQNKNYLQFCEIYGYKKGTL